MKDKGKEKNKIKWINMNVTGKAGTRKELQEDEERKTKKAKR